MFDIRLIREHLDDVKAGLSAKRASPDFERILKLDSERRELIARADDLRNRQNEANAEIGRLMKAKENAAENIAAMKGISAEIARLEPEIRRLEAELDGVMLTIPNLPHASVPVGGEDKNVIVRQWGEPAKLAFQPKTHIEIAESLDIIDFKRAAKISGSNFVLFKGLGARLERALLNFMLDTHTAGHGYKEIMPPVVVNAATMTGTGQLPKMAEDMYKVQDEDLYLIPTAEVPVTNIHRDEILREEDLPVCYAAFTPCFRREAGSYGKDTRGLVRVHQFDKVELVKFVKPETSYDELEKLLGNAEAILQKLNLPYRIKLLASGDLSFAAAKCYDIEVYSPGLDKWLEVSSCSNFEDFQARRSSIRYKGGAMKKPAFVHTLNGSGIALARCVVAILENYQTPEGEVAVPPALVAYMGDITTITRRS